MIRSWNELYQAIETHWSSFTVTEKKEQLTFLEESAQSLLDSWGEMEEKLAVLKQKENTEETIRPTYQSVGTSYYILELFDKAQKALLREQATGAENELRMLYLGFSALYTNDDHVVLETFLYLIQTSRSQMIRHFSYVGLGCYYTQLDQIEKATELFQHANELTTSADVVYNLGVCHYVNKHFSIAKTFFNETLKMLPEDGESYFLLGCCEWELGNRKKAWECLLSALGLLYSKESLLAFAKMSEWHGHHQIAIHCYKRIEDLTERSSETTHGLAWNYALMDEYEKAINLFSELTMNDPHDLDVRRSINWLVDYWPKLLSSELKTRCVVNA